MAKPQGELIFALDMGTRTVIGLFGEKVGDEEFRLLDYAIEPHLRRAMTDGQVEDIQRTAKTIKAVKERIEQKNGVVLTHAAVAAAGRALRTKKILREFDITGKDSLTENDIKSMETDAVQTAQTELDDENTSQLFYCVGSAVVAYYLNGVEILNLRGYKGHTAGVEIIATFLPNMVADGLYAAAEASGLKVSAMTLEPIAAMNLLIPPELRVINAALVDVGAGTSDIAAARDKKISGYGMATIAGDEVTEEIQKELFTDFDEAERLKENAGTNLDKLEYRDIFGFEQTILREKFLEKIQKSTENLASTISEAVIEINGGVPAALFLAGGGSLLPRLDELIAEKLELPQERVRVGSKGNYKGVDINGFELGAQFITPLGIALTAIRGEGYEFSMIILNGEKMRVFDRHYISVSELLRLKGYRLTEIVGRSGRSLTFSLNGRHRQIKGSSFTPAIVIVNGVESSVDTEVTQGDVVEFTPAINGETAKATLGEMYTDGGVKFFVNGELKDVDYQIQSLDKIEVEFIEEVIEKEPEPIAEEIEKIIDEAEPEIIVEETEPEVIIEETEPEVIIEETEPEVIIEETEPEVIIEETEPEVIIEETEPEVIIEEIEPEVIIEEIEPEKKRTIWQDIKKIESQNGLLLLVPPLKES